MADFAKIYNEPNGNPKKSLFITAVKNVISYDYSCKFWSVGEYTVSFPLSKELVQLIARNQIIEYDGDTLIVDDYSYDDQQNILTVKGTDLKGLLNRRVVVPVFNGDTYGYDVISGTTADCIYHYIDGQIMTPVDTERVMFLTFDRNSVTGINDSYMAKGDYLSDVIGTLCQNAGIGYNISFSNNGSLKMSLLAGVDRSMRQSSIPRVVFSKGWKNVVSQSIEYTSSNLKNAIYANGAGVTQVVYRDSTVPEGFERHECSIDVNTDTVADIELLAKETVKDNILTQSFKVNPVYSGYGTDYSLGDVVSVRDEFKHIIYSGQVTEVTKNYTSDNKSLAITVGNGKPKFLNRIINNLLNNTQQKR